MHVLSFDIEEWFLSRDSGRIPHTRWGAMEHRAERSTGHILEMLDRNAVKATFFVLGWIAEKYPRLVKQISASGHDIGFHSYYHARLGETSPKDFDDDLHKGLELLRSICGHDVHLYRAPYFSFNGHTSWVVDILLKHGIHVSSSVKGYHHLKCGVVPNQPFYFRIGPNKLLEMPLGMMDFGWFRMRYSGSGYFRILPLSFIKKGFRENNYTMTYFHPRDFDPGQPFSKHLSLSRNLMNHIGTRKALNKFENLLGEFPFMPISEAQTQLEAEAVKVPVLDVEAVGSILKTVI